MNCRNCGSVLQEDDIFCKECGHKVADDIQQTEEQSAESSAAEEAAVEHISNAESAQESEYTGDTEYEHFAPADTAATPAATVKKFIPLMVGAAALIIIVICAVLLLPKAFKSNKVKEGVVFIPDSANDTTYVINNGKIIGKISEECCNYASSMDYSCRIVTTYEGSIYLVNSEEVKKIDSDLNENDRYWLQVSSDGSNALYKKDDNLYIYNVSSGKSSRIAENVYRYTISPDGSAVLYSSRNDDDETICYIYCKGNTTKIDGKNTEPVAIANNAKYVYYAKNDDSNQKSLYVFKDNDIAKLASDISSSINFNKDLSEVLYYNEKGSYISVNGMDGEKIYNGAIYGLVNSYGSSPYYNYSDVVVNINDVDSLKNRAFYSYDFDTYNTDIRYVSYIKKEWSTTKIVSDCSNAYMSSDLNSIAYLKNDKIMFIKNIHKDIDTVVEMADDIVSFVPSDDLDYFYAVNQEKALQYISHKKSKKIADDVNSYNFARNAEGYVFFISDNIMYTADKDKQKEKINGNECELSIVNNCVLYTENNDGKNLYANTTGKKFECIAKGME